MRRHLQPPILCLITDRTACLRRSLESVVSEAVAAGVTLVQLREKSLPARELFELGSRLLTVTRAAGAALIVNDRVDVALALGAEGVHLGSGSLPVAEARRLVGDRMLVGVSVHSLERAERAEREGADYLVLGTIFETQSHPGVRPAGPDLVHQVASAVALPVIAIGGIKPENAAHVMAAGAAGVAVITAIQSAEDVSGATRALRQAMAKEVKGGGQAGNRR